MDSDARVNMKINERFKSLSIRNIKNHSTTPRMNTLGLASTARGIGGGPLSRRKNMAGIKHLKDIGVNGMNRNFSPQIGAINFGGNASPSNHDANGQMNLTQTLLSKDSSLRKQKE